MTTLDHQLRARTDAIISSVNYRKAQHQLLSERLVALRSKEQELVASVERKTQAIALFAQFTEVLWEDTKTLVQELVTRGIQVAFGPELEFKVLFEAQKNNVVAVMWVTDQGEERDLLLSDGGGLVDFVTILLRVSILLLKRPAQDRILVLDEPMKMVSLKYRVAVLEFLKALTDSFGVQFVIVTHHQEFEGVGLNYVFDKVDGKTVVLSKTAEAMAV